MTCSNLFQLLGPHLSRDQLRRVDCVNLHRFVDFLRYYKKKKERKKKTKEFWKQDLEDYYT